jgi:23S rRNA pseudouridine2604 synthase
VSLSCKDTDTFAADMKAAKNFIYIAYNKPVGIICTTEKIEGNIIDAIKFPERILPIGRLDKASEGLLADQ